MNRRMIKSLKTVIKTLKGSKNHMWNWIVSHNFHTLEETVFIDDVLSYLKQAEEKGVIAYHISSFIE